MTLKEKINYQIDFLQDALPRVNDVLPTDIEASVEVELPVVLTGGDGHSYKGNVTFAIREDGIEIPRQEKQVRELVAAFLNSRSQET